MTVTVGPGRTANERAISPVRSVEASSTTMISKWIPSCETRDSRQRCKQASSFRAGTMMETTGTLALVIQNMNARTIAGGAISSQPYLNSVIISRCVLSAPVFC